MNRIGSHQADMEFVDIPGTSMRVSRVALGTWAIGGWMWGGSNENDAISAIHAALRARLDLARPRPAAAPRGQPSGSTLVAGAPR